LLNQNIHKIHWGIFSENPNSIYLIETYLHRMDLNSLSEHPNIFELDYNALKERCSVYTERLISVALHPLRIERYLDMGIECEDLDNYI